MVNRAIPLGVGHVDNLHRPNRARLVGRKVGGIFAVAQCTNGEVHFLAETNTSNWCPKVGGQVGEGIGGIVQVVLILFGQHILTKPHISKPELGFGFFRTDVLSTPDVFAIACYPVHFGRCQRRSPIGQGNRCLFVNQFLRPVAVTAQSGKFGTSACPDFAAGMCFANTVQFGIEDFATCCRWFILLQVAVTETLGGFGHRTGTFKQGCEILNLLNVVIGLVAQPLGTVGIIRLVFLAVFRRQ